MRKHCQSTVPRFSPKRSFFRVLFYFVTIGVEKLHPRVKLRETIEIGLRFSWRGLLGELLVYQNFDFLQKLGPRARSGATWFRGEIENGIL